MTARPLSEMSVLELCVGEGVAIFKPEDRASILAEAQILAVQVPAAIFRHPMVGKVEA